MSTSTTTCWHLGAAVLGFGVASVSIEKRCQQSVKVRVKRKLCFCSLSFGLAAFVFRFRVRVKPNWFMFCSLLIIFWLVEGGRWRWTGLVATSHASDTL